MIRAQFFVLYPSLNSRYSSGLPEIVKSPHIRSSVGTRNESAVPLVGSRLRLSREHPAETASQFSADATQTASIFSLEIDLTREMVRMVRKNGYSPDDNVRGKSGIEKYVRGWLKPCEERMPLHPRLGDSLHAASLGMGLEVYGVGQHSLSLLRIVGNGS